ncbi:uncharacterized protein LOC124421361 [Lucilia cuprina]|uniref:uncharacterized protein LOC124421361 n=1 Tax=Lucilia cuprina TaxID=7375 RepID=UPI001F05C63C|nr:uncharacterized protein LOC124421361 [Lucilia cuprina]
MCMLKAKLSGEAAKKISKLPSKDENFEVAWSILNEYYSDKRAITSIYFKSILEAPFVTYNVKSVNMFLTKINESLQALEAMKLNPEEMQKAFLCFVLQRKLDDYLIIQFEQHLGKSKELPKVDSLVDFLKQIQYSLEESQDFTKGERKMVNPLGVNQWSWEANQNVVNPSRQNMQTQGASQKTNPPTNSFEIKCPLNCAVGHNLNRCSKFRNLSINEKWDKVRDGKVCFRCLGVGHSNKMCKSNFICGSCNGDHYTLLHREKIPARTVIVNGDEDDEAVLLTAVVEIKDGNGHWKKCRVLLDGGAQVNIISKEFRIRI